MSTPAVSPAERYAKSRERLSSPGGATPRTPRGTADEEANVSAVRSPEFTSFRELYDFDFDPFQVAACAALTSGDGVLVAAPTGSGKTVVGEYAVHLALRTGRKCFYTTPIKALSNQKYNDLVRRYDSDTVGLLTGDNAINGDAPVVVMTTEVLRNMLYAASPTLGGLGYVVLDEVHYLADRSRGAVWEEVIIHLPESVRVVALSATVSNAEEFGDWLAQVRGGTEVIVDEHRPVPLWQHMLAGRRLYDLFTDDEHHQVNPDLIRLAHREAVVHSGGRQPASRPGRGGHRPRRDAAPYRPEIIDRLDAAGLLPAITFIFSRAGCDAAVQQCLAAGLRLTTPDEARIIEDTAARRVADISDEDLAVLGYHDWVLALRRGIAAHHAGMLPVFKEVVEELFTAGLVKAVFATETLALGINMPARTVVLEKLDKWNGETHAALTPGEYTQLTGRAGRRGIDVEGHAVVLWQPGIDPGAVAGLAGARTYPLNSSFRPSYNMAVNLTARVGRAKTAALLESSFAQFQADRGVVGLARRLRRLQDQAEDLARQVTCDRGDFMEYAEMRRRLTDAERGASRGRASAQRAEARRVLATLRRGDIIRVPSGRRAGLAVVLIPPPAGNEFSQNRADGPLVLTAHGQLKQLSAADFPVPADPVDRLRIPNSFSERSPKHRRDLVAAMRSKIEGRDLDVPPRRRRSPAGADEDYPERVRGSALSAAGSLDAGNGSGRDSGGGRRRVRGGREEAGRDEADGADQDGYGDADASDGPGRDSNGGRRRVRSGREEAGRDEAGGGGDPGGYGDDDAGVRSARGDTLTSDALSGDRLTGEEDIAELRRRLKRHPCHACPDREQHARYAERYFRAKKEADELERQVAGRRHVIARTFDRVCSVLDELGYLDGDTVTPAGQRLTRLYSEMDLLAAECLRRGLWEGLNPAELAACVSVLSFESRKQTEDAGPARLPKGPVGDALTAMTRTWGELDHLEKRNGLSFLREPDPGIAGAAYRWVRGAKLEDVLDSVPGLTPGDFVRSMKQLIDLLDQIAVASRDTSTTRTGVTKATRGKPSSSTKPAKATDSEPPTTPEPTTPEPTTPGLVTLEPVAPEPGLAEQGDTGTPDERPSREPAPRKRDVASTAHAAIDAMRRGVIAYTTLTD
jgi:ATP-dependent RNA helicase HelY